MVVMDASRGHMESIQATSSPVLPCELGVAWWITYLVSDGGEAQPQLETPEHP
jgi:hypothetical protein